MLLKIKWSKGVHGVNQQLLKCLYVGIKQVNVQYSHSWKSMQITSIFDTLNHSQLAVDLKASNFNLLGGLGAQLELWALLVCSSGISQSTQESVHGAKSSYWYHEDIGRVVVVLSGILLTSVAFGWSGGTLHAKVLVFQMSQCLKSISGLVG